MLVAALLQPAVPLREGQPAPNDGILWPEDKTRKAVACLRVDLPDCERRLKLATDTAKVRLKACQGTLAMYRDVEPPPEPETPLGAVLLAGGGGLVVGALVGVLLVVTL